MFLLLIKRQLQGYLFFQMFSDSSFRVGLVFPSSFWRSSALQIIFARRLLLCGAFEVLLDGGPLLCKFPLLGAAPPLMKGPALLVKCSCRAVAGQLPDSCQYSCQYSCRCSCRCSCRAVAGQLPGSCRRAVAARQLLPGSCRRATAAGQLPPGSCRRTVAAGQLPPYLGLLGLCDTEE